MLDCIKAMHIPSCSSNPPKILQTYIRMGKTHGCPCLYKSIYTHEYQPFWPTIQNKPIQPNPFTIKTHHNPPKQIHLLNPPKIIVCTHPICSPRPRQGVPLLRRVLFHLYYCHLLWFNFSSTNRAHPVSLVKAFPNMRFLKVVMISYY
jgi:hypothetical protein